jgi:hypothetical protein
MVPSMPATETTKPEEDFLPDSTWREFADELIADKHANEVRVAEALDKDFDAVLAEGRKSKERIAAAALTDDEKRLVDAKRRNRPDIAAQVFGLRNTIDLRKHAPKAANDNSPYPGIVSSADFVSGFVPPDYHLDGVAQAGFIYALTASTGTGKTAVMLALTSSTALGTSLCGREVRKGRVLYLAGENPDDVRMRWLAMAHHQGFDPADMDVHFIPGTFSVPGVIERVSADVERLGGVDLVIVDTSAAYFQGDDENGNTPLGKHARELRQLCALPGRPAVVVACHPTKNADPANLQPRGGGAFIAEVDGNLTLTKADARVKLHWQVKHRGADFTPLYFALETVTAPMLVDSKGRSVPTVMAVGMADWVPAPVSATKAEPWQSALDVLTAAGSMTEHEWCAAYIESEPVGNADSVARKWRRHRVKLIDLGKVVLNGDQYSLADTGHGHSGHVRGDVRGNIEDAQNLPADIADTGHGHSIPMECPGVRMSGDAGPKENQTSTKSAESAAMENGDLQ